MSSSTVYDDVKHPELVIGLVGPIGVDMDNVQEALFNALKHVNYDSHLVHITKLIDRYRKESENGKLYSDLKEKISEANTFCKTANNGAALAGLAIKEISEYRRSKQKVASGGDEDSVVPAIPKQAYIIRQLKRRDEVELLRTLYGDKFIQVSVFLEKESRIRNLETRIGAARPDLKHHRCQKEAIELIDIDEFEEGQDFGQQVGDIFHLGDYFVDGGDKAQLASKTIHFVRALFGDNAKSPDCDEFGAFMASSASLRSVDLSRQVGAAITTPQGDIISVGCNEVPKAGGGNYWFTDPDKARDIERGNEQNSIEKKRIIVDFLTQLQREGVVESSLDLTATEVLEKLSSAAENALISDITEYGRMTHAEMTAICDAARLGRSLQDATIYVTTFPCHNCAKHIVASGIKRVVFIEPYPKSKASSSHFDSISIDGAEKGRVKFQHFEGISPKRYAEIFRKGKRKRNGAVVDWFFGEPRPMLAQRDNLHVAREPNAILSTLGQFMQQLVVDETTDSD
ncbi:anti-phage dCTP deaminase [Sulfitobacter noctilucae]|uniref:anti-phage dCTP deaminase n=1 Tax=Sulfitobacter noctilucae TaxID=1342302 RepID=UPI0004681F30|nr:anti-phage dCTP deaminase [Sulfitobacter noctilucae]